MARVSTLAAALAALLVLFSAAPALAKDVREPAEVQRIIQRQNNEQQSHLQNMRLAQADCDLEDFRRFEEYIGYAIDEAVAKLNELTPVGTQKPVMEDLIRNELLRVSTMSVPRWKPCEKKTPQPEAAVATPPADPFAPPTSSILDTLPAELPAAAARPQLAAFVEPQPPASFCSELDRVNFLNGVYTPAAAIALSNSQITQAHMGKLNGLFTQYMRTEGGPVWAAIQREMAEYKTITTEAFATSNRVNALYQTILAVPVAPCAQPAENGAVAVPATGQPLTPLDDRKPAKPGKPDCPPEQRRKSIVVGPNSKVGSGARLKAKAASTALGIAGGLLGSAAGLPSGGGGGGSGGPPTVVCKIKDGEMTVFNDPASGISLKIGAKRAGGTVVVFSEIAKSPDNGTFQTAFLENGAGDAMAPADVGICDLWGEWKLTVSWTKTTYVDGQVVKRESGGWQKAGRFSIPGVLSSADRPDGLWKQLGFSNASHGARKIAMQYKLPPGGGPVDAIIHVTRPSGDPVTTVPFALRMVEGPNGFTFTEAPDADCPEPPLVNVSNDAVVATPPAASNPPPQAPARPPKPVLPPVPVENLFELEKKFALWKASEDGLIDSISQPQVCPKGEEPIQNLFGEAKTVLLYTMRQRLEELDRMVPAGDLADGVREAITAERKRLLENQARLTAMEDPGCVYPDAQPEEPAKEPSILDSIKEVPVIS